MTPPLNTPRTLDRAVRKLIGSMLVAGSAISVTGVALALNAPVLVEDIYPGPNNSTPASLLAVGSKLFFFGTDGVTGSEPWVSDATMAGTTQLQDVLAGPNSGTPFCTQCNSASVGSIVYFSATTGTSSKLWRTDGTTAGTSLVYADATAGQMRNVGGSLYFIGSPTGFNTTFLFKSDGTSGGTAQVSTIFAGGELTDVNGTAFFWGGTNSSGSELCKSDAGGTSIVQDMNAGSGDAAPLFLTNVGGLVFYRASNGVAVGLCRSDGTNPGTYLLRSLTFSPNYDYPGQIVDANGTAFLIADDGVSGKELWKSDGTVPGTVLVKDINPGPAHGLDASSLVVVGSTVYFSASDGATGKELWKSDGTAAGTVIVKDIFPMFGNFGSSAPSAMVNLNGTLYFRAQSSNSSGVQPWMSDGSTAGTVQIAVMHPTPGASSQAASFTQIGSDIYLTGTDGTSGIELWVMSGAPVVGVGPGGNENPRSISLSQNNPNPVRAATQIYYSIPSEQHVRLKLFDVAGREIRTLVSEVQPAGEHRVEMGAMGLPGGVYFYRLETGTVVRQKKMLVLP